MPQVNSNQDDSNRTMLLTPPVNFKSRKSFFRNDVRH